jgi:hypothetical protein
MAMSLWYQALLVFGGTLVVMGYFQYRRNGDIVAIVQEMARWSYLGTALIITICYVIIYLIVSVFNGIL